MMKLVLQDNDVTFRTGSSFRLTAMRVQRSHRKLHGYHVSEASTFILSFIGVIPSGVVYKELKKI